MRKVSDDNRCFVCGIDNDRGLQFDFGFNKETKEAESQLIFSDYHQGWKGIVHGGLLATVLDEIQIKAASFNKYRCVTAELNIKYKKPVKTESLYYLRSKILKVTKKIIYTEASLEDKNSKTLATATAKLFII